MHALFAHKSLQITFLPCICLFRGGCVPLSPAHDDGTVRRHAACSPLEGERGGQCEKLPVSVQLPPCFLLSHRHPTRCARRHRSRLRRRADATTKFCTQSANTPLVQLHTMTAHNAKQNRIKGKEDNGGEMKKNLPSPTRRTVVEIRVNKLQANPVSGHIERGARPLPATETELRSRPRQSGDTLRDEAAQ